MELPKKKFIVEGGRPLKGEVTVHGSKNAVLPIIAATLLTTEICILDNVPRIEDVFSMKTILEEIGSTVTFEGNTMEIDHSGVHTSSITSDLAKRMRASVLLIPGLLHRFGEVSIPYPGGCVLGKRPIDTHLRVFEQLGATVEEDGEMIVIKASKMRGGTVVLDELSVTASENALIGAALSEGVSDLRLLACEPHVTNLAEFLMAMGVQMEGAGGHFIKVTGAQAVKGVRFRVTPDYLETGTFAIAAALTRGDITVRNTDPSQLDIVWNHMEAMGIKVEKGSDYVRVYGVEGPLKALPKLQTGVYPQFPTDLQAPFAVLFTQAEGVSKVYETLFDGRLNYLMELEKMRAHTEVLNPHQAIIIGPTPLRAAVLSSWDIRAGMAIVLAALAAEGTSEINNIYYIDRGYERIDERLNALGAKIERCEG